MKTMGLLCFPKLSFFLLLLPSLHLSFPSPLLLLFETFLSCWKLSCSSCYNIQPLQKPQVELASPLLLSFHLPEALWHLWCWVSLFWPFPQWVLFIGLPCDEPVLRASWQGQQITLPSHSRGAPGLSVPYQEWATRYVQAWFRDQMSL